MQTSAAGIPLVPAHIPYPVAVRRYAGSTSPYYQQKSRQWCVLYHSDHRMNGYGFFLLCRVCRPYGHIFPQFEPALSITRYYAIPYVREPVFHSAIGTIGGSQRESGNGNAGIQISHIRVLSYISNQNDFIY